MRHEQLERLEVNSIKEATPKEAQKKISRLENEHRRHKITRWKEALLRDQGSGHWLVNLNNVKKEENKLY